MFELNDFYKYIVFCKLYSYGFIIVSKYIDRNIKNQGMKSKNCTIACSTSSECLKVHSLSLQLIFFFSKCNM